MDTSDLYLKCHIVGVNLNTFFKHIYHFVNSRICKKNLEHYTKPTTVFELRADQSQLVRVGEIKRNLILLRFVTIVTEYVTTVRGWMMSH